MVDLIRNMVVSDKGNARQFLKGPVPSDIGVGTLDRLRRAGALADEVAEPSPLAKVIVALADAAPKGGRK